jgi:hypothetical protein
MNIHFHITDYLKKLLNKILIKINSEKYYKKRQKLIILIF